MKIAENERETNMAQTKITKFPPWLTKRDNGVEKRYIRIGVYNILKVQKKYQRELIMALDIFEHPEMVFRQLLSL